MITRQSAKLVRRLKKTEVEVWFFNLYPHEQEVEELAVTRSDDCRKVVGARGLAAGTARYRQRSVEGVVDPRMKMKGLSMDPIFYFFGMGFMFFHGSEIPDP